MITEKIKIKIRATGILIQNGSILLLKQKVTNERAWSLPGGSLEAGETIAACLQREFLEETGIKIQIKELLYICDRIEKNIQVVHITFLVKQTGGKIKLGFEPENDANKIHDIQFIKIDELSRYGFSDIFIQKIKNNFTDKGTYKRDIRNIGL